MHETQDPPIKCDHERLFLKRIQHKEKGLRKPPSRDHVANVSKPWKAEKVKVLVSSLYGVEAWDFRSSTFVSKGPYGITSHCSYLCSIQARVSSHQKVR